MNMPKAVGVSLEDIFGDNAVTGGDAYEVVSEVADKKVRNHLLIHNWLNDWLYASQGYEPSSADSAPPFNSLSYRWDVLEELREPFI